MTGSVVEKMRIGVVAVTAGGRRLAHTIAARLPSGKYLEGDVPVAGKLAASWREYDGFVCIMAAGIVVRAIAPLLENKRQDPGVVVMDEKGRFAVSLLSGHLGGGNDLAREVAGLTGGRAVITTASDTLGLTAVDLWAREQNLAVADPSRMAQAAAALVNLGQLIVFPEVRGPLPPDFQGTDDPEAARVIISCRTSWPGDCLVLHSPQLVVGVGCNRGTVEREFEEALEELLVRHALARQSITGLASIHLKSDEAGLLSFAERNGWPLRFFRPEQLNEVPGVSASEDVIRATGAKGVAEPSALLAAETNQLIVRKEKWKNVTLAVAKADYMLSAPAPAISNT